MVADEGKY